MILHRSVAAAPARFTDREVDLVAVPFSEVITVDDGAGPYREAFDPDVKVELLRSPIPALLHHDPRQPFGVVTGTTRTRGGLRATLRASRTALGDEVLEMAADGVLYPSVGFTGVAQRTASGVVWRTAVLLHEITLTTFQAYPSAAVDAVRSAAPPAPYRNRHQAQLHQAAMKMRGTRP